MNSRMTACASCFTFGGMSPFTITFRRLYFLQLAEKLCQTTWFAFFRCALTLTWCPPSESRTASARTRSADGGSWFSSVSRLVAAHPRPASKTSPVNANKALIYWKRFRCIRKWISMNGARTSKLFPRFMTATRCVICQERQHGITTKTVEQNSPAVNRSSYIVATTESLLGRRESELFAPSTRSRVGVVTACGVHSAEINDACQRLATFA